MDGEVLTTDVPKCAESVGVRYPQGIRVWFYEGKVIAAVQKQIW